MSTGIGEFRQRLVDGLPAEEFDLEDFTASYSDPRPASSNWISAGFDASIMFPDYRDQLGATSPA